MLKKSLVYIFVIFVLNYDTYQKRLKLYVNSNYNMPSILLYKVNINVFFKLMLQVLYVQILYTYSF